LDLNDLDVGSSGVTLLPHTSTLIAGGKEGVVYVLNANNLGRQVPNDTQIPQKLPLNGGAISGGPAFWNSAAAGPLVYNWSVRDVLKAFHFNGTRLDVTPYAQGTITSPGHPGGSLAISANGNASNTGIVWASMPTSQDGIHGLVAGILRAYGAETLREMWNTERVPSRDRLGTLMKFVPPVVANGRVYAPNHDNAVSVYGLLPSADFTIDAKPATAMVAPGGSTTFTVTIGASSAFTGNVSLSVSGLPPGVTGSFSPSSVNGAGVSTLTVTAAANTPIGTATLTITGTCASVSHSARVTLIAGAAAPGVGAGIEF
jgi:hypothetical protein